MDYWKGNMNWPLSPGWVCETCGTLRGLTWGITHGVCRCNDCHTHYSMRDEGADGNPIVDTPISLLKDDYKPLVKSGWEQSKTPISTWDDNTWDSLRKEAAKK